MSSDVSFSLVICFCFPLITIICSSPQHRMMNDVWPGDTNSDAEMVGGNCWHPSGRNWVELDPDWSVVGRSHSSDAGQLQKRIKQLPVLEPMRLDELMRRRTSSYSMAYPQHQQIADTHVVLRLTVPYGGTAHLPCPVRQLGNRTVSWLKHSPDDVQLLTVGNSTYSSDGRLLVAWRYPGNWTLQISPVELHDAGCYQCQVNTHPPISLFVHVDVRGPAVTIVDDRNVTVREAVFKQGALIRLICLVRQASWDYFPVQWRLGTAVFNHDTERGGVSIKTERHGRDALSWLLMVRATTRDSGIYTCSVDSRSEATVSVHVIQGEHQAAVHEMTSSSNPSIMRLESGPLMLPIVLPLIACYMLCSILSYGACTSLWYNQPSYIDPYRAK